TLDRGVPGGRRISDPSGQCHSPAGWNCADRVGACVGPGQFRLAEVRTRTALAAVAWVGRLCRDCHAGCVGRSARRAVQGWAWSFSRGLGATLLCPDLLNGAFYESVVVENEEQG